MSGTLMDRFYGGDSKATEKDVGGLTAVLSKLNGQIRQKCSPLAALMDDGDQPLYDVRWMLRPGRDSCLILKRAGRNRPEILFVYGDDFIQCVLKASSLIRADKWSPDRFRIEQMEKDGKITGAVAQDMLKK